jgi:protein-tyrosine-phosphatase
MAVAGAALFVGALGVRAEDGSDAPVVFVCEHGTAKSLMAASYFNQLSAQRGLKLRAVSRGSVPDASSVPAPVLEGLRSDGVDARDFHATVLSAEDVADARQVVAIGTHVPASLIDDASKVEHWNDVPAASTNFDATRSSLKAHVEALLDRLAGENDARASPSR